MFHDWMGHWSFGWIWIIAIIVLIWVVISQSTKNRNIITRREDSALDVLRKRYASGEISKEEFLERRSTLEEDANRNKS